MRYLNASQLTKKAAARFCNSLLVVYALAAAQGCGDPGAFTQLGISLTWDEQHDADAHVLMWGIRNLPIRSSYQPTA